jgi:hypothetical protein
MQFSLDHQSAGPMTDATSLCGPFRGCHQWRWRSVPPSSHAYALSGSRRAFVFGCGRTGHPHMHAVSCSRWSAASGCPSPSSLRSWPLYSPFGREVLAPFLSIRHFRWIVEGGPSHCLPTTYCTTVAALLLVSTPGMGRKQRHLVYIIEHTNDLVHAPVSRNAIIDALYGPGQQTSPLQ